MILGSKHVGTILDVLM